MDFSIPAHVQDIVHRMRQFVDDEVLSVASDTGISHFLPLSTWYESAWV